ncbi:MAG TPA: MarR family transcriptional regulator [Armatimonadaceae bacterium]|nr:MarR family transcriptional regulator [Armatimonadaceae bacterium]
MSSGELGPPPCFRNGPERTAAATGPAEVKDRGELLEALQHACRDIGAATIMFHHSVAERLGLNATDHKCGDILFRSGPLTAGDLAERTGLTTGAITAVIDRMEKAGFVRRERDAEDRRKVIVHPNCERMKQEVAPLFASLAEEVNALWATYTDEQLALALDVMRKTGAALYAQTVRLRDETEAAAAAADPGE